MDAWINPGKSPSWVKSDQSSFLPGDNLPYFPFTFSCHPASGI
jgi:hypothetical protein